MKEWFTAHQFELISTLLALGLLVITHLRRQNGELLAYPNNLFLQKAVSSLGPGHDEPEGSDEP